MLDNALCLSLNPPEQGGIITVKEQLGPPAREAVPESGQHAASAGGTPTRKGAAPIPICPRFRQMCSERPDFIRSPAPPACPGNVVRLCAWWWPAEPRYASGMTTKAISSCCPLSSSSLTPHPLRNSARSRWSLTLHMEKWLGLSCLSFSTSRPHTARFLLLQRSFLPILVAHRSQSAPFRAGRAWTSRAAWALRSMWAWKTPAVSVRSWKPSSRRHRPHGVRQHIAGEAEVDVGLGPADWVRQHIAGEAEVGDR